MTTYLTVERTMSDITLQIARRLTEEERKAYQPEYQDYMMVSMGDHVDLPNVSWMDLCKVLGDQQPDGQFPGCGNQAYIITQEQWDTLVALDCGISAEVDQQTRAAEVEELEAAKASAERQMVSGKLPTKEGATRKARDYNNVHNEGGYGYVPHYYSDEEYQHICSRLATLKGEH